MGLFQHLIEAFFPFRCHICSKSTSLGKVACVGCRNTLSKSLRQPVSVSDTICDFSVQTLSKYDSFISDVIKLIKYRPSRKLLNLLVAQIESEDLLEKFKKKPHIFVPVPMHRKRLKVRGFNQAEVLAASFAEMTGGHFSPVLIRNFATKAQASCVEEERLTNLDQAISLAKGVDKTAFIGKTIIIVDDVATTGTTLNTCKISLEKLKPRKIIGLVVSHSFKRVVCNDAVSKANVTIWN